MANINSVVGKWRKTNNGLQRNYEVKNTEKRCITDIKIMSHKHMCYAN